MKYFVYVDGFVGVKTNATRFSWSLGKCAPQTTFEKYDKCLIKVHLEVRKDNDVFSECDLSKVEGNFRHFYANKNEKILYYKQKILKVFNLNYYISIKDRVVHIIVGKTYFRLIKYKIMNIHPIWYVLYDIVTGLLLLEGYLPLYCASVKVEEKNSIVMMAPPNMGKSFTALRLYQLHGTEIIAEDMAITDGKFIWSVPWTKSYRKYGAEYKKYILNMEHIEGKYCLKQVCILEKGTSDKNFDKVEGLRKLSLINQYCVGYKSSPVVSAMAYFNAEFSVEQMVCNENRILSDLISNSRYICFTEARATFYSERIWEENNIHI